MAKATGSSRVGKAKPAARTKRRGSVAAREERTPRATAKKPGRATSKRREAGATAKKPPHSLWDSFVEAGLIGIIKDAPPNLSMLCNDRKYMERVFER
jgi:hypothetical protein